MPPVYADRSPERRRAGNTRLSGRVRSTDGGEQTTVQTTAVMSAREMEMTIWKQY